MNLSPGSRFRSAQRSRARLHARRTRALLRWGIALPLTIGFGLVAANALLVPRGLDLLALRDLARLFLALPMTLMFALGWAYLSAI